MDPMQAFIDRHEIEQRYVRYCELIDHGKQFEAMGEVFTPDTHGEYAQYGTVVSGVDQLIAAMRHNLGTGSNCGATQHYVNNFRIAVDGDRATGRCHFYAVHQGLNRYAGRSIRCGASMRTNGCVARKAGASPGGSTMCSAGGDRFSGWAVTRLRSRFWRVFRKAHPVQRRGAGQGDRHRGHGRRWS
ncbi:nuclear transport factor 2 family protein [Pseudomonas sp. CR3202]|uniref:nuclear transport factor 2 family protein n=1 Tax=Pseudomonas sp. CR3202 TaxID=3351532 RepID=UPI003BF2EF76